MTLTPPVIQKVQQMESAVADKIAKAADVAGHPLAAISGRLNATNTSLPALLTSRTFSFKHSHLSHASPRPALTRYPMLLTFKESVRSGPKVQTEGF